MVSKTVMFFAVLLAAVYVAQCAPPVAEKKVEAPKEVPKAAVKAAEPSKERSQPLMEKTVQQSVTGTFQQIQKGVSSLIANLQALAKGFLSK